MDNFFGRYFQKREEVKEQPDAGRARGGSFADHSVRVYGADAALSVAAFHRAIELRARTMSQLRWEFQVLNKDGGNFTLASRGPQARRLNYLLQQRPNPMMSASQMQAQAEVQIVMSGNAYIYIERDGAEVAALWLCTSGSLNPLNNTYCLTYNSEAGPVTMAMVSAADVLHIRNTFSFDGGLTGCPTLQYAANALSIAATNDKQTLENAAKGGKMKLLMQEEKGGSMGLGRASRKEMEKARAKMQDEIYDNDVVLLTNVANITPISQNAQQQELLESRKFSVSEIARLTGVPKAMLMDDSGSSYKSPEAATQEFLLRTISPKIREWEDEVNAKLIGPSGYGLSRFHLCELPLMRLDPTGQANLGKTLLETGVMSVNELRRQYDLATVDGGDIHYISTNLAELGSTKLSGEDKEEEGGKE